jgi:hypothetical protein
LRIAQFWWAVKVMASEVFIIVLIPWLALTFGLVLWVAFTIGVLGSWLLAIVITTMLKTAALGLLKRQHVGIPTVLPDDFVLYLRPFEQDSPLAPPPADPFRRGFEGCIVDGCSPRPVIALRGGTFVWETPGLAWVAVTDHEWQAAVRYLASRASYILILAGESPNLAWEVATVVQQIPPQRVALIVRRQRKPDYEATVSNIELDWEDNEVTRARYRQFARTFPYPLPRYVRGGTFVRFPEGWNTPQLTVAHEHEHAHDFGSMTRRCLGIADSHATE